MATKIFVTVGTHPQNFDRLIKEMDAIASKNKQLEVFGQIGYSNYKPKNFDFVKLINAQEYAKKVEEAEIIVSHGGAGAIIHAMKYKKKLIVVPRLEEFNEHTNDHQLDLAELLETHNKAFAVSEINELEATIKKISSFKPDFDSTRKKLIIGIQNWFRKQ